MILIHLITKNFDDAIEMVDILTKEKLILNAVISKEVIVRKEKEGKMVSEDRVLVMGKTKGLLFDSIDKRIRALYPNNMPVLYSVPITHMDWEQADYLVKHTARV